jgi:hypothetical protein
MRPRSECFTVLACAHYPQPSASACCGANTWLGNAPLEKLVLENRELIIFPLSSNDQLVTRLTPNTTKTKSSSHHLLVHLSPCSAVALSVSSVLAATAGFWAGKGIVSPVNMGHRMHVLPAASFVVLLAYVPRLLYCRDPAQSDFLQDCMKACPQCD